jgi:RNA polymerase sigma-70 factor, ECF subfamily
MIATQRTTFAEIMPPPDDAALVQAAQKDISAFSLLYQRYVQQVYRYLLARVGNAPDAQDLTSQTFMAAMQGLKQYRGQQPFIAWLLGIARHKAADQFRQRRPDVELDIAELLPGSDDALEDQVGRRLEMEQIGRKLQAIAPDRAEALSLRLFAGLEVAEIARIMARNEAAVRMLVFRGLRDLQQQLNVSPEERR